MKQILFGSTAVGRKLKFAKSNFKFGHIIYSMKFRPCIDIHNGKVKQIVGSSLTEDSGKSYTKDNFVSQLGADYYANLYKEKNLSGGHVILLNKEGDEGFEETKKQALLALSAYPNGLQIGGGINDKNASFYIERGASHVIVTSFVFSEGRINMERLLSLCDAVGHERIVLDLSVKLVDGNYHIATDRWQKISEEILNVDLLEKLSSYCDEFLIHAAHVEGKRGGVDESLLSLLSKWKKWEKTPVSYAGGIRNLDDIETVKRLGLGHIDFTVGSALSLFGGDLSFEEVCSNI